MNILNFRIVVICFVVCFLSLSCSKEPVDMEEELNIEATATNSYNSSNRTNHSIKDHYIILLSKRPAMADQRANAALEALTKEVGNMPNARIGHVYRTTLTGFSAKLSGGQLERLKNDKRVQAVYPDEIVKLETNEYKDNPNTPNVQEYATWGLDRIDQREKGMDWAYSYSATGKGVNVYIMDSGIRYSHSDFGTRASLGVDLVKLYPYEFDENDPDLEPGNDCNGHGTHVAGTVGGKLYGVAKDANLISVRVFSCIGTSSWSRIIQAIEWVTDHAVKPAVVNMSLGGNAYEPLNTALENSIATGIHYVVAAGNFSGDACNYSPASVPVAITVGGTLPYDRRLSYSNDGNCVDIYAPGYNILSASHLDDISAVRKEGTSMAAPHVAGVAALYLEKFPSVSPAGLENEIIQNSTPDILDNISEGPNRLVYSVWEPVNFEPPTPPNLNLRVFGTNEKGSNQYFLVWDKTEDTAVEIYMNGSFLERTTNTGEYSLTTKGKGDNTFVICEMNYNNCSPEVSADFGDTDYVPNQPPTADFSYTIDDLEVSFFDESTDPDGSIVKRTFLFGDDTFSYSTNPIHTYSNAGVYTVRLTVIDDYNNSDTITKEIVVETADPPAEGLELSAVGSKNKGKWQTTLTWTPAGGSSQIDIYREGKMVGTVNNTGSYVDNTSFKGGGSLEYKVCETGSNVCSNSVVVQF